MNFHILNFTKTIKKPIQFSAILFALLLFIYFLYSFGLNSGFFLDDLGNLQSLSNITEFSFDQIVLFTLSGFAGPTGRPLSLLTFALQFNDWPNNPAAFKLINVSIHLINTILVFILSKQLFKFRPETQSRCIELALLVTIIWSIHPIQVSTVLYSIQRMTQLSATFVLLGIITYLHGFNQLTPTLNRRPAYLWMSAGLIFGTVFSMLCKENGILILLFLLVIEKTILNTKPYLLSQSPLKNWQLIFIKLPIALVVFYLFYRFDAVRVYQYRNFSLTERLVTENAVLFDYLKKFIAPTFNSFSLYYDDFPISKKLTDSYQTFFGFLIIASTTVFSIVYRKRFPFICFGFLWYFSGHLLESTFIPLELYFEHRNYLPLLGLIFIIVILIYKILKTTQSRLITGILYTCTFLYISSLSLNTYVQTNLWGSTHQAKLTWALEKPNSTRAQSAAANVMAFKGNYLQALKFTKKIIKLKPNDPSPYLAWLQYRCFTDSIPHPDMEKLFHLARQEKVDFSSIYILNEIVITMNEGKCKNITYQEISQVFQTFGQNKNLIKHADFYQIYSMMEGYQGHYIKALNLAEKSLSYKADVKVALFQIRWLVLMGDYSTAYQQLEKVKNINKSIPKTSILFIARIKEWEDFILNKLPPLTTHSR